MTKGLKQITAVLLLLTAVLFLAGCKQAGSNANAPETENPVVAYVDGEPVTLWEYSGYAYDFIAQAGMQFGTKYNADVNDAAFWNTEYEGITPLNWVKQQADERMRTQKGMQVLAKQLKLNEDISWEEQQKAFAAENELRRQKAEKGEVVYGPAQFTKAQFYSYWQSNVEQMLEDHVKQNVVHPTKKEIEECYERNEAEMSRKNFSAQIGVFSWMPNEEALDIGQLEFLLEQEEEPQKIAEELNVTYGEYTVNTREMGKENQDYEVAVELLKTKEKGQLTSLFDLQAKQGYMLVLQKEYEEVGDLQQNWAEFEDLCRTEQMRKYIDEKIQQMQLEHTEAYEKLGIDQLRIWAEG